MIEVKKSSLLRNSSEMPNPEISINSILVWLFYLEENIVFDEYTENRFKNFYGLETQFLNPKIRTGKLLDILKLITKKNENFLIKICLHWRCVNQQILKILNKTAFNIVEIYVITETFEHVKMVEAEFDSKITSQINLFCVKNIKQLIEVAESEVQHFTKSFRTNYNSVCLTGEPKNNEAIKRYRFRLISFINLKRSDEKKAQEEFKRLAQYRFTEMKRIEQAQTGIVFNSLMKKCLFDDLLCRYLEAVQKYRQNRRRIEELSEVENQIKNQQMAEIDEDFWTKMVEIYQQQGFFYQIINRNLRIIKQQSIEKSWTALAQPFSFLYKSIKNLHLKDREKNPRFYKKSVDNYVYRGGRIRDSQINEIIKAAIKINKHSQKEQLQILKNILMGKRPLQSQSKALFMEFYGFLSTSTNLDIVLTKFLKQKSQKDQNYDFQADYSCIFKINIKNNEQVYRNEYLHLLHGFYMIQKNTAQQQVLFNALNVFKLKRINRKMIVQGKLFDFDQKTAQEKDLVYEIELQYGPFFDFVLEKNNEKLNQNEILVKKSYCFCYNKIKRTDQFDIGDAHQTLNQLAKSQQYFQSKVIQSNIAQQHSNNSKFLISKLDNKNYFLRLSQIYDNRGMTSKAIQYARLSIQCYKHMENAEQNMLFIKHMEKLFEMQKRIIDFLQRVSDSLQMQNETNIQINQLNQLQNGKNHPHYLMRASQLNLKKGVLSFQKGNIDQSKNMFDKCEKSIKNVFDKVDSLKQNSFKKQFVKNWFCCSSYQLSCIWSYQKFEKQVKKSLGLDQIESKKQDFDRMLGKAVNLSNYAGEAIEDRIKAFKDKDQYRSIIQRLRKAVVSNLQTSSSEISSEHDLFQKSDNELLNMIQQKIIEIRQHNRQSPEYKRRFQTIQVFIKEYSLRKQLTIYDGIQNEVEDDFIQKFLKKERQNRLAWIQFNKSKVINQTLANFQNQFNSIIAEIQQTIKELKEDCVSEYNSKLLIERNQLAKVAWDSCNYELALQQIQLIVKHGDVKGEQKQLQLAKAYKTKSKISLKSQKYQQAVAEAQRSLDYHMALIEKKQKKRQELVNVNVQIHPELQLSRQQFNQDFNQETGEISKNKFYGFTNICINNQFIQSTILRCKAYLYFILQTKKSANSQKNARQKQKQISKNYSLVEKLLVELNKVILKRRQKLQLSQLQIQLPQIEGLYRLVGYQNRQQLKIAFTKFNQCINLRNTLYSESNSKNFAMCTQIICNFASKPEIYKLIQENGFFGKIEQFYNKIKDKSSIKWKVQKVMYLRQKYNPKKDQRRSQISEKKYLQDAISTLMSLNDSYLAQQTHQLQKQLKEYDPQYILWTEKSEEQEMVYKDPKKRQSQIIQKADSKIRVNSNILGKRPSLKPIKKKYLSQLDKPIKEEEQREIVQEQLRQIQQDRQYKK